MISKDDITIVIPFLRANPDRFLNLKALLDSLYQTDIPIIVSEQKFNKHSIRKFLEKFYPKVQYIKSTFDVDIFNKSKLVNIATHQVKTKYIWQLDCDVILKWEAILNEIPDNADVIKPFRYVVKLTQTETNEYRNNGTISLKKGEIRNTVNLFGQLSFIVKKDIYDIECGMDERFEGWGYEDLDFAKKISQNYQIYECNTTGIHLNHPISSKDNLVLNRQLLLLNSTQQNQKICRLKKYNPLIKKDICIIISYFSPCNFKLPKKNFNTILKKLIDAEYPICIVEAVMPGADKLSFTQQNITHKQIIADYKNIIFQKEVLINMAPSLMPQYNKFIFLDSDVELDDPNWLNKASELLDEHDIIQPYETAIWLNKTNTSSHCVKISGAKAIADKLPIHGGQQHPGFAWGMTRECFDKINGFYYQHPFGGSDTIIWLSLVKGELDKEFNHWVISNELFNKTKSYKEYRENIQKLSLKVGYIHNCSIFHLYHGTIRNRQYINRNFTYMPELENDEYPVHISQNGLLCWNKEEYATKCLEYFKSRMEDD